MRQSSPAAILVVPVTFLMTHCPMTMMISATGESGGVHRLAVLVQRVDRHADGPGRRAVEQHGRGQLPQGRQEDQEEGRHHPRLDQGQDDILHGLPVGGAAGAGRLLQRVADLLQGGRVDFSAEGHVAGDVGHEDDPGRIVEVHAELPAPHQDHAQRDDRAGHREGQAAPGTPAGTSRAPASSRSRRR